MKLPDFVNTYLDEPQELVQMSPHVFGLSKNMEDRRVNQTGNMGEILIVSGLSGSGKDAIIEKIIELGNNYKKVKTCTTRQRRPEESDADDPYVRITIDQLHEMLIDGTALECTEYAGNYYCTSRFEVKKVLDDNRTPILRVDPQGAIFFLESRKEGHKFLKDFNFTYIFIVPTSFEDLRERLIQRGGNDSLVNERIEQSRKDITFINSTHFVVVNEFGYLETVAQEIMKVLK